MATIFVLQNQTVSHVRGLVYDAIDIYSENFINLRY